VIYAEYTDGYGVVLEVCQEDWSSGGDISSHVADKSNPHEVTAAQVGALPLTGGTMTGNLLYDCASATRDIRFQNSGNNNWTVAIRGDTPSQASSVILYDVTNLRTVWSYLTNGNFRIVRPLDIYGGLTAPLSIANGGTNAATAAAARTNLGLLRMVAGSVTITVTNANSVYNAGITFSPAFASQPTTCATAYGANPGRWSVSTGAATASAMTIYATSTVAGDSVIVRWMAVGT